MKIERLLLLAVFTATCILSNAQLTTTILVTNGRFDKVTRATDFKALQQLYGKKNVKDEIFSGPEGVDSIPVTTIYSGTNREFTVYWKAGQYHKKANFIDCFTTGSPYITNDSLKIGSSLRQLLKANGGKRISFSGFGWDYGGLISSYGNGAVKKSNINYMLGSEKELPLKLEGEVDLNTDMPLVKKNLDKITVRGFTVHL